MPNTEMTTVYVANGQPEAEIIKGRLETEGIPVMLRYESAGLVYGLIIDGLGQVKVQVPSYLAQEANEILTTDEAEGSKLADQADDTGL